MFSHSSIYKWSHICDHSRWAVKTSIRCIWFTSGLRIFWQTENKMTNQSCLPYFWHRSELATKRISSWQISLFRVFLFCQLRNSYRGLKRNIVSWEEEWCRTQYFFTKQTGENNTRSPDKRGRAWCQRDKRQCDEGDPRIMTTPARRGQRSHRDEGDDTIGIVGVWERWPASVGGCGVAGAGGQRRQALKWKWQSTCCWGGVCGKALGWGGHGVRHGRRWKRRPSR